MATSQNSRLYLLSSSASSEYVLDILEVLGSPRGLVHHFRYARGWIQDTLWNQLPKSAGLLGGAIKNQRVVVVYLYQEEPERGQWNRIAYYPIRTGTLRDAYQDGGTGHFHFEVDDYFDYPNGPSSRVPHHEEIDRLVQGAKDLAGKYAFVASPLLGQVTPYEAENSESFQAIVNSIIPDHLRTVRAGRPTVSYKPVFVLVHPIREVRRPNPLNVLSRLGSAFLGVISKRDLPHPRQLPRLWATRLHVVKPKFDAAYRDAFCRLREEREYAYSISTYHPGDSPIPGLGIWLDLDYPEAHFVAAASRGLSIASRYDHEVWRLLPLPTNVRRWSLVSLRKSGVETVDGDATVRVLAPNFRVPVRIASKWFGRRFWILLDIFGDAGLALGTVSAALLAADVKGPWTLLMIVGYAVFALAKAIPRLWRGE